MATHASGTRRLVSLCFLLALVVLMMQKASDPRHIRSAFQAIGVPLEAAQEQPLPNTLVPPEASLNSSLERTPAHFWRLTCEDLIPRLLDGWPDGQIVSLGGIWFATEAVSVEAGDEELSALFDETAEHLASLVAESAEGDGSQGENQSVAEASWHAQLVRFSVQWKQLGSQFEHDTAPDVATAHPANTHAISADRDFARVLDDYLDRRLVAATVDRAAWKASERVAFWRLLQAGSRSQNRTAGGNNDVSHATPSNARPAFEVSTLQLESDASRLKGKTVRFRGSVRRVEEETRKNVLTALSDRYWILWVRGLDNANQPVAIYTQDPRAQRIAVAPATRDTATEIEVSAVVGKRLAYVSESGLQVAPTLFAADVTILEQTVAAGQVSDAAALSDFAFAAALGGLAGGLIVIPLVVARLHKRARRDRSARNVARSMILALACVELGSGYDLHAAAPQAGPPLEKPPWAEKQAEDPVQAILRERLPEYLTGRSVQELQAASSERGAFPDDALKAMRLLSQLGWERIVQGLPFEINNSDANVRIERFEGLARSAKPIQLSDEQVAWFNLDDGAPQLFEVQVDLSDSQDASSAQNIAPRGIANEPAPNRLTVYCTQIPSQWSGGRELLQPVRFVGLALRTTHFAASDVAVDSPPVCLLAGRPEWILPANLGGLELMPELAPRWATIGKLGWDLAWLDLVHSRNQQPISGTELESYFSLMRVASSSDVARLTAGEQPASPRDVMSDVKGSFGRSVRWSVRLVSGNAIAVSGRPRATLGADRYFQLDGFVDLGNERIVYELPEHASSKERITFDGEFPVTLVSLNTDLVPADVVAGRRTSWEIGQYAELQGVFYRMWSYQSEMLEGKNPQARQAAPLIVALSLKASAPPVRQASAPIGWFGYALCAATLGFLGAILYFSIRNDTRRPRRKATRLPRG